jgi:hypothetical protein
MKSSPDILVWDSSTCPSKTIDFIPDLQRTRKAAFANIIIIAPDPHSLPSALGDLTVVLPVVVRFGPNAIHDAIIDVVSSLVSSKGQVGVVLITGKFSLWVSIFQRLEPKSVVFISNKDPNSCLELTFFPQSIPTKTLTWPGLEAVRSSNDRDLIDLASEPVEEEEVSERLVQDDSGEDESPGIQPLANLEKYQIDLRSPAGGAQSHQSDSPEITPKRRGHAREDVLQIPAKFQPLVEAMKSIGKALISLGDLEGQLKVWSEKLNEPIDNINSYIAKATDAQIIIYDKAINYVRFRNRAIATAKVEYV